MTTFLENRAVRRQAMKVAARALQPMVRQYAAQYLAEQRKAETEAREVRAALVRGHRSMTPSGKPIESA